MSRLMHAIRSAVLPGMRTDVLSVDPEDETDGFSSTHETPLAEALLTGGDMSASQTGAGAVPTATGALAAVAAAASGGTDGFQAAMDRINAIVSAEGIAGDGARMSAALALASAASSMTAEAVVAFVSTHVPVGPAASQAGREPGAVTPPAAPAAAAPVKTGHSYEESRAAAGHLAMPNAGASAATQPAINRDGIFAARRAQQKGD